MEPTQELNLTQDLAPTLPDQVGILGIEGEMHPIISGVNKIGRDPSKCSIVINANSLSRQHALIDVKKNKLFGYDCMLVDMNSRNQTKLRNSCLLPYKPTLLEDGDVIHLGDVIGVFRLCNIGAESELPMTQAMEDTPVRQTQTPQRNRTLHRTVVPESPELSDKDDSCNISTDSKSGFKVPKLLRSTKGYKTADADSSHNSTQSESINLFLDDADGSSMNDSAIETTIHVKHTQNTQKAIYEIETQPPDVEEKCEENAHSVDTQLGNRDVSPVEIQTSLPPEFYDAPTQCPSLSIHEQCTQKLSPSIYTAQTQMCPDSLIHNADTQSPHATNDSQSNDTDLCTKSISPECVEKSKDTHPLTESDEEIIFDEFETQGLCEFGSQALVPISPPVVPNSDKSSGQQKQVEENNILENSCLEESVEDINLSPIAKSKSKKKVSRIIEESDSSTDCEDIDLMMTQKIATKAGSDDDLTDCEEIDKDNPINDTDKCLNRSESISELATQILDQSNEVDDISELPTQIISEKSSPIKPNLSIQQSPKSANLRILDESSIDAGLDISNLKPNENNDYYNNTQDLISDLCTQQIDNSSFKIPSSKAVKSKKTPKKHATKQQDLNQSDQEVISVSKNPDFDEEKPELDSSNTEEIVMNSQKDDEIGPRFPGLEDDLDIKKMPEVQKLNTGSCEGIQNTNITTALPLLERELSENAYSQSDLSDDGTPKKDRSKQLLEMDLPDSQEIKKGIKPSTIAFISELSSGSDQEQDSEQNTPIVFKTKTRVKKNVKVDLISKFNLDIGPRASTRIRKPTTKMEESEEISSNFLKSKHFQDPDIDTEIISENIEKLTNRVKPKKKTNNKKNYLKDDVVQSTPINQVQPDEMDGLKPVSHTNINKNSDCRHNNSIFKSTEREISEEELMNPSDDKKTEVKVVLRKCDIKSSKNDKTNVRKSSKDAEVKSKSLDNKTKNSSKRVASDEKNGDVLSDEDIPRKRSRRLVENTQKDKFSQDDNSIKIESTRNLRRNVKKAQPNSQTKDSNTTKVSIKDNEVMSTKVAERKSQRKANSTNSQANTNPQQRDSETKRNDSQKTKTKDTTKKINKGDDSVEYLPSESDNSRDKSSNNTVSKSTRAMRASKYDLSKIYQDTEFSPEKKETRKRSAPSKNEKSKRVKTITDCLSPSRSSSRSSNFEKNVLFSAYTGNRMLDMLKNIGATTVTDVESCSVLVTKQLKRTAKIICAIGLGKPIVGPSWLLACKEANTFINPWLHILKDETMESRHKFELKKLLSGPRDFLKGYNVSCTPHTMPPAAELKPMVEYCGGRWREGRDGTWLCMSVREDSALWPSLRTRGARIVSAELILSGIFAQRVDLHAHAL